MMESKEKTRASASRAVGRTGVPLLGTLLLAAVATGVSGCTKNEGGTDHSANEVHDAAADAKVDIRQEATDAKSKIRDEAREAKEDIKDAAAEGQP